MALSRYRVLGLHLHDEVTLKAAAEADGVSYRTAQRWLAAYRSGGLDALDRAPRADRGCRRMPDDLVAFIEGLALKIPRIPVAAIHRQAVSVAVDRGWPSPGYETVRAITTALDPGLMVMALQGSKRYREVYELVYRREAKAPNEIWQADHTQLDIWVLDHKGKPQRPWLTVIEDDHSRAVAGYAVALDAPSALSTALAFRHAIWRKTEPDWHVCGIPTVFHLDHGSDFTSAHLEQVMADLHVRPVYSKKGEPHGHGKIERLIGTVTVMCLPHLPGYAPRGTADRAGQAKLTLPELDAAIGRFIRAVYNTRAHSETGEAPQARWESGAFIPRMPDSLEQLDLLLTTVATPRKIHTDGIHFLNLRYLDPVLADYVTETATVRYDPRDITEIRVYLHTPTARSSCAAPSAPNPPRGRAGPARQAGRHQGADRARLALLGPHRPRRPQPDRRRVVHRRPPPGPSRQPRPRRRPGRLPLGRRAPRGGPHPHPGHHGPGATCAAPG